MCQSYRNSLELKATNKKYSEVRLFHVIIKHLCDVSHPQVGHNWWYADFTMPGSKNEKVEDVKGITYMESINF